MIRRSIPLLAVLMGAPSLAHAEGDGALGDAFRLLRTVELLIPDARYERSFTADEDRFVLSLPFVWRAGHVDISSTRGIVFNHFAEVQYEVTRNEWRGVLGERALLGRLPPNEWTAMTGWLPFLEAGALLGTDGSGAMVGGGLAWGDGMAGLSAGVVVRFVVTNQERRGDIAFDVQFPFNAL